MKIGKLKSLFIYLVVLFFVSVVILPPGARATSQSSLLVNVAPQNPAPGENTTITLSSYASNLDSVLISWSVDGKNVASGIGKKTFSLNAPSLGGESDVVATVSLPDGALQTKVIIKPAVMVLLWQATDSYVPPFYKGKAFPTPESQVKVVAIPQIKSGGKIVDPNNLTYVWQKDYTNNPNGSGYG
ncbi:MAG: hypothetical protein ACREGC_01870, partial [Minisyncoccia bacterium]